MEINEQSGRCKTLLGLLLLHIDDKTLHGAYSRRHKQGESTRRRTIPQINLWSFHGIKYTLILFTEDKMIPLLTTTLYFYNYINLINSAQASNAEMEPSITPLSLHFSLTDNIVNPYNFSFVLQTEACRDEDELLIVIHSSTKVSRQPTDGWYNALIAFILFIIHMQRYYLS